MNLSVENWSYNVFCKAIEYLAHQSDANLKKISFDIYDSNQDGFISEIDVFSTMGCLSSEIFTNIVYSDFRKLNETLSLKKRVNGRNDEIKQRMDKLNRTIQAGEWKSAGRKEEKECFSTLLKIHEFLEAKNLPVAESSPMKGDSIFNYTQDAGRSNNVGISL
jgi:hypothetical protein